MPHSRRRATHRARLSVLHSHRASLLCSHTPPHAQPRRAVVARSLVGSNAARASPRCHRAPRARRYAMDTNSDGKLQWAELLDYFTKAGTMLSEDEFTEI
eukprot:4056426-Prymnesium_polylepis.1